jgi:hypothetical protein
MGNAEAIYCAHSAICWSNALAEAAGSLPKYVAGELPFWLPGSGGSITDVPPWPSLDAVKFASE